MFRITNTHTADISWSNLVLTKGENVLLSRKQVPPELWPKLDRFRKLGLVQFDGDANALNDEPSKLSDFDEARLFNMGKNELAELAKAHVPVAEGASKRDLINALMAKMTPPPGLVEERPAAAPDITANARQVRGRGPVTIE